MLGIGLWSLRRLHGPVTLSYRCHGQSCLWDGQVHVLASIEPIIASGSPPPKRHWPTPFFGAGARPDRRLARSAFRPSWRPGGGAGFIVAGAIGFVWLLLWWIFFDHPDRVSWLHPTNATKSCVERDGEFSSHHAAQPASSLWYLLTLRSTWRAVLTQAASLCGYMF